MIRVAILDRHPAVRAGLDALIRGRTGFVAAGSAADPRDLAAMLYRTDPDVVVLDELDLVARAKTAAPRTRVVLYLAGATPELLLASTIAGADGMVDKAADVGELLRALREVASGERALPEVPPQRRARAAARLDPRDRPIFAMRLAGTSPREIAAVAGMTVAALNARVQAIVAQLAAPRLVAPGVLS
jgi:DNA-binding NarL/FixJ family response regulator